MLGSLTTVRTLLERWHPQALLLAGWVLLASPVTKGIALFADVSTPVWLLVLLVFPGLLAALAGLLGIAPALAEDAPRLAVAGGVATLAAFCGVAVLFAWTFASSVAPSLPGLAVTAPPESVFQAVIATIVTGSVLVGLASLRAGVHSRLTGLLLLGFAAPWVSILAAGAVLGGDLPGWLALPLYGAIPLLLVATGYTLRGTAPATDTDAPSRTPSAS